jgi:hypothetical protein
MSKWLLFGLLVGFTFSPSVSPVVLASEDGASLLEERCSVCHPSTRPKSKHKTPEQWEATVTRMMGKGARLTEDEKKILLEHLSSTYKP